MNKLSFSSLVGGVILLATAFLLYHTFDEAYQTSMLTAGRGPVFYPRIILSVMLLLSLIVIGEGLFQSTEMPSGHALVVLLAAIVVTGAYIFSINWAGFVIPTLLFSFLLPMILGYRNWPLALGISVVYTTAVWYIFEKVFLIILPSSPWFEAI